MLKSLNDKNKKNYYKSLSAIEVLKNTPLVFDAYKYSKETKGDIILHIYGLLQNMFVSVDALYDLCRLNMNYKYNVNINQNETLRKVKHIRNDIVGHPTQRTYEGGGVGYSVLNLEKTTLKDIYYETHFFKDNNHEIISNNVDTYRLIEEFINELKIIIEELKNHLIVEKDQSLSTLSYDLANNVRKYIYNLDDLNNLKDTYIKKYKISLNSSNRILWRIRLLAKCFTWSDTNKDVLELIEYLTFNESYKIHEMFAKLENVSVQKLFKPLPKLLKEMYQFLNKNKDKRKYIKTLLDSSSMYYKKDLEALKGPKIISYLETLTDADLIYLVGKGINDYKPKSKEMARSYH